MNETTAKMGVRSIAPLKALVWKELRQAMGWGALGLLSMAASLTYVLIDQKAVLQYASAKTFDPGGGFFTFTYTFGCAFLGLLIGLVQVFPESRGDKWGFLSHRPVSRSTLFLGKVAAGTILYAAAAGIPLIGALVWMATPGHLPVPFDWRLGLPAVADLCCGIAYYFCGLLIGMRDSRWYGSRAVSVGAPFLCSISVRGVPEFWQALTCCALAVLVTGTAAWGTFTRGGQFETQPYISRAAVGVTVAIGLGILGVIAVGILSVFIGTDQGSFRYFTFEVMSDGTIARVTWEDGRMVEAQDLDGRPISQFRTKGVVEARLGFAGNPGYRDTRRFFQTLAWVDSTAWYYVVRLGLCAGYDLRSASLAGWMGPDGFIAGENPPLQRFTGDVRPEWFYGYLNQFSPLLTFADSVYRADLKARRIQRIFMAAPGESVTASGSSEYYESEEATPLHSKFDSIVTTKRIVIQDHDGTNLLVVPRSSDAPGFGSRVSRALEAAGTPTFVWTFPRSANGSNLEVIRIGENGLIENRWSLQDRSIPRVIPSSSEVILGTSLTPATIPAGVAIVARLLHWPSLYEVLPLSSAQWILVWVLSFLGSLAAAILAYLRAGKYALRGRRKWLWTCLCFALGPLSFLLMLSLLEWPALEKCPECGRKRVVTRERCTYCNSPFLPPAPDGTEIMEPLEAARYEV
jgi:hypothetical protein